MKTHESFRIINGVPCCCQDIGCDDFERAEYNRYIITNKLFTTGYQEAENALASTPLSRPLPSWIPRGSLPQVGKEGSREIRREFGGDRAGEYEIIEPIVVGT